MKFQNGNAFIEITSDGTRTTSFKNKLKLDYPRQADIKLTNWCNMSSICTYCHEKSNFKGKHADFDTLIKVIDECGPGVEWAFGGGSTLHYPKIKELLLEVKKRNQIANVTVNQLHLKQQIHLIEELIENDLIKGLGLSYRDNNICNEQMKKLVKYEHTVVHLICGVNHVDDIKFLNETFGFTKFLVLGYKEFGMGIPHYQKNDSDIEKNKLKWYQEIHKYFGKLIISFDNLGLEQLNMKRWLSKEEWDLFYQGDDMGESGSMYFDAVEQNFARTSRCSERVNIKDSTLIEFFNTIINN